MGTEKKKKFFRLVDLIVVIIIFIVLAVIYRSISRPSVPARFNCASNLKQIGLALIMYANKNNEKFPDKLSDLYPNYVSDRKVFRCPNDGLVTNVSNASITKGVAFTKNQCSYGYDNTHTNADDPGVALVADRPPTITNDINNSQNHAGRRNIREDTPGVGQHVAYIDGHVEYVHSPLAGWYDKNGKRDNIYVDNSDEGTDSYIRYDGK